MGSFSVGACKAALDRMMADARAGRLDVVAVWRFDRFALPRRYALLDGRGFVGVISHPTTRTVKHIREERTINFSDASYPADVFEPFFCKAAQDSVDRNIGAEVECISYK